MTNFYYSYYLNIVKYDLIHKFNYSNIFNIPSIVKLVLSFEYKKPTTKKILSSLLALNLIGSGAKGYIITTKKSNISLKLRAGNPVGCKITLRKLKMFDFLSKFFLIILPQDKILNKITKENIGLSNLSFKFKTLFLFSEFEQNYLLFKDLSNLTFVLVTNSKNFLEFLFLLKALKFKFFNN